MSAAHLFVYGSLLTGTGQRPLEYALRGLAQDRGRGWIQARLYDLGDYPGALPSQRAGDRVVGRLFRLRRPPLTLRRLDRYERYDPRCEGASEFVRRQVEVRVPGRRRPVLAWAYYLNRTPSRRPRVTPGDWAAWLRRRRRGAPLHPRGRDV